MPCESLFISSPHNTHTYNSRHHPLRTNTSIRRDLDHEFFFFFSLNLILILKNEPIARREKEESKSKEHIYIYFLHEFKINK